MYYDEAGYIQVEKTDQCYTCRFFNSVKNGCPLLEALALGAVEFEDELNVANCSWYEKKLNHLKIVKNEVKDVENL